MVKVKMVWAEDQEHAIGKNGDIPWNMPDDLKLFRDETVNTLMIMGRSTWLSIGRPLPNRTSVVMTQQADWHTDYPEVKVVHSVEEALNLISNERQEVSIAGGATIYREFMPYATDLIITRVDGIVHGDTFVDDINLKKFKLKSREPHAKDDRHDYAFVVERYERI
ncbi:dihydrofolate reductase [Leuconostoc litchii]|uniref:Dihydrofolate reductase n=1 Tax=Leuconostoc litchii TaxID=1981069 RepID=A0A6P2CP70_9LACO|nr:dihydrofolate reductase [Leuconostoc litchii]TYC47183.1 dihydrofolate reductase [Leuconostoc litchii]GMA69148.1 dihydrofolate reductase [Leuconostoc litchii]